MGVRLCAKEMFNELIRRPRFGEWEDHWTTEELIESLRQLNGILYQKYMLEYYLPKRKEVREWKSQEQ